MCVPNAESDMAVGRDDTKQTEWRNYNHRNDVLLPILAPAATFPPHLPTRASVALHG